MPLESQSAKSAPFQSGLSRTAALKSHSPFSQFKWTTWAISKLPLHSLENIPEAFCSPSPVGYVIHYGLDGGENGMPPGSEGVTDDSSFLLLCSHFCLFLFKLKQHRFCFTKNPLVYLPETPKTLACDPPGIKQTGTRQGYHSESLILFVSEVYDPRFNQDSISVWHKNLYRSIFFSPNFDPFLTQRARLNQRA